ncbi:MAG: hypothetical protein JO316_07350 [Abitibacteriaceae bacterium]|nr:hypothetical protein [Abditibacteriaceae bacterium]MBV9865151.1 hypothetical protein [Abditibacteriaceae bacterium]
MQTSRGTLNVKLGGISAGTQFDQLEISGGSATLGGTLNVSLINGFHPAATTRFKIISGTYSGRFATVNGPFTVDYASDGVYLKLNTVAPLITSFTPGSGLVGATVTISGTNLSGATVFFNGVRATLNTAQSSASRLVVTVPNGATTGPIQVVTSKGSFTSATKFTVTQIVRYIISGSISSGTAPIPGVSGPVPNVPVFLLTRTNLSALAAVLSNPALIANSAALISRTTTNAAGQYSFSALPGSYYVVPAQPGVFFTSAFRAVTVSNAAVPNQNFSGAGVDNTAPTVTISTATATTANGKASDGTTGSGILTVVVTLQNSSNQYLNWTATSSTPQFTANAVAGSYKLANAAGSTTPILNLNKISSQSWSVTLPAKLPTGSYRLTVRAIDRAFRISVPATQVIVVKAAADVAVVSAASPVDVSSATFNVSQGSLGLRFNGDLEAQSASDTLHYTVTVNGNPVTVESAGYNATNHSVTLSLPEGALQNGDRVVVSWQGLLDEQGRTLDGETGVLPVH